MESSRKFTRKFITNWCDELGQKVLNACKALKQLRGTQNFCFRNF